MEGSTTNTNFHPSPDDTKENLNDKLTSAIKQLEDKDRQLDHYKQLVKTLQGVLADVHAPKGHGHPAPSPSDASKTSGLVSPSGTQPNPFALSKGSNPSTSVKAPAAAPASTKVTPVANNNNNNQTRPRRNSRGGSNDVSRHEWPVSSAQNLSFLSDDDEPEQTGITQSTSNSNLFGLSKESEKSDKSSWRRPAADDSAIRPPGRTTTVTPATTKTVTINSNPLNSPRGLKKSVSHHSLSAFSSDKEGSNRPLAPLGRGIPSFKKTGENAQSSQLNRQTEDDSNNNKLKKSQSMTSVYSVLEENRLDLKFPELDQMVGQIYALSKYQQGCRFLQKKLDEDNPTHTNIILTELMDHLMELMTDPFGNYLFSKLMEHCSTAQKEQITKKIISDLLPTAFDMYGTQSMQKMMPFLTETQIDAVVNALKPSSIALIKHNKANYLIQYCLDHLSSKHNQWIFDAVCENMDDVGRDRVGCVIVKRCIDHASDDQMSSLFDEICNKALSLVQDPFGNYVVQHVLEKFPSSEKCQVLISRLLGSITDLCVQKFSSNVVERCLKMSNNDNKHAILTEITETDMLAQLLNDRFANFVVQTALDVAEPDDRQALVKNILPHLGRHYSPYTKRLQKKILQV